MSALPPDALPAGTRFSELEVVRVLGVGGFGIVYLAHDHALQREVALKEYMPGALAGRGRGQMVSLRSDAHGETYALGLRSFVNEARLLARFNHPSLVKVYRFWEENGTAYMLMPYLQGGTLRDARRAMTAPPDEAWIRAIVTPLLDALELLHREDVFHRDIAPDNILLPSGEPPVLLDFGAARRAIGDRTQTFTAILKPSYAPIEQYAEVEQLRQGPWTDLYALGAVVHFLLRGEPPVPSTARAVHDSGPLLPPAENPQVSPQFLAAIEWTLAVRPADRPQSIAALRQALGAAPPAAAPMPAAAATVPVATAWPAHDFAPTLPMAAIPARAAPAEPAGAFLSGDSPTMPALWEPSAAAPFPPPAREPRRAARMWLAAGLLGLSAVAALAWTLSPRTRATPPSSHEVAAAPSAVTLADPAPAQAAPAEPAPATAAAPLPSAKAPASSPRTLPAGRTALSASPPVAHAASAHPVAPRTVVAAGPAGPREACGRRRFLALALCMEEQCETPRYAGHPECKRVRDIVERRKRGEAADGDG